MIYKFLIAAVCWAVVLLVPAHAQNSHNVPQGLPEMQAWFGDGFSPYVVSGCAPTVPSPASLTFTSGQMGACTAYVRGASNDLIYTVQSAAQVGGLSSGNGTYWLALRHNPGVTPSSWTCQAGTRYCWRLSASQPAVPTGGLVFAKVTVAGGAITAVHSVANSFVVRPSTLLGVFNVKEYGAKGDGTTDDSGAIRTAEAALTAWTTTAITGTASSEAMGGATLYFPATTACYKLSSTVTLTSASMIMRGAPAKICADTGVTAFSLSGSPDQNGVLVEHLHFAGGAIAIDMGTNAVPRPLTVRDSKFVNQTTAGVKTGASGFQVTIQDSTFTGIAGNAIHHQGSAADVLTVERSVFIYNAEYDIRVQNANVFRILGNDFVQNLNAVTANRTHIYIDTTVAQTGGYSIIANNKFGPEGRTDGSPIVIAGANPLLGLDIHSNFFGFDTSASGKFAINISAPLDGLLIHDNQFSYCDIVETTSQGNAHGTGMNRAWNNWVYPYRLKQDISWRVNWQHADYQEALQKTNILPGSRPDATSWPTRTNITFSSLTAANELGLASQASTFQATSASNLIRSDNVTLTSGKLYTLSLWMKQDSTELLTLRVIRGATYVLNRTFYVDTTWTRYTFELKQAFEANPFVIEIVLANGRTLTLGTHTAVEGYDVGDLEKYSTGERIVRPHYYATAAPASGYYGPVGAIIWNTAGTSGQPMGWLITTAGDPPTLKALPNVP